MCLYSSYSTSLTLEAQINFNKLDQMLLLFKFQSQPPEKELLQNKFISLLLCTVKLIKLIKPSLGGKSSVRLCYCSNIW